MKNINKYITEYIVKKKLDTPIDSDDHYEYFPETKEELIDNIKELLDENETNINCIDTSKITDMSDLFYNSKFETINIDVSNWDVSNVKDMSNMFYGCKKFEGKGLENWNVSNVTNMSHMFYYCKNFDCDLSNWNVSNANNMASMFYGCSKFKGKGLEKWNVNNKAKISSMFVGCNLIKKQPDWYIKLNK